MILVQPDSERRVDIPGAPGPVRKPVDIDETITGFRTLRTLRVYRFDKDSVIEGHAEADEVYLVLLSGSVEVAIRVSEDADVFMSVELSAPSKFEGVEGAAYLPPGAFYRLFAKSEADVAYVRAAATSLRAPRTFASRPVTGATDIVMILESGEYAESLRFRLASINVRDDRASFVPFGIAEIEKEKFLLVTGTSLTGRSLASVIIGTESIQLTSRNTVVSRPGEYPALELREGSDCLALMLMA